MTDNRPIRATLATWATVAEWLYWLPDDWAPDAHDRVCFWALRGTLGAEPCVPLHGEAYRHVSQFLEHEGGTA